jgi:hypothetical protein
MENEPVKERPNIFWNRVYAAVVATTFIVVTALWAFSQYFSS